MVAGMATVVAQETRTEAETRWKIVADAPRERQPKPGALMDLSRDDVLGCRSFPCEYWTRITATSPLEPVNGEGKRRADVTGVFPNDGAIVRRADAGNHRRMGGCAAMHEP